MTGPKERRRKKEIDNENRQKKGRTVTLISRKGEGGTDRPGDTGLTGTVRIIEPGSEQH